MKRTVKHLFCSSLLMALAATGPLASGATGRTEGAMSVSRLGEATYRIPIATPPGVKGMAPNLALTYEHRRAAFSAGVGWMVEGLSRITRCPLTVSQDGLADPIRLSTADRFCLDGNRLRLDSGAYGALNSTYRLQIDLIARVSIPALGAAGDPQWFRVEHKNGLIYEYGNTANSRIESLVPGKTNVAYIWALNRIVDREGNAIQFAYQEDGSPTGAYRVSTIDYASSPNAGSVTPYRVTFVYENKPAGDVSGTGQYIAGGNFQETKRIDRIDVTHLPTSTLVRRYELTYEAALSNTNLSRLQSIQECAGAGPDCYPATTFTYANSTIGVGAELLSGSSPINPFAIDINGDGRTDLVYSSSSTSGAGTWMYQLANSSSGFDTPVNSGIVNTNFASAIAIEYDGDGKDDILVPYSGTTWWVIQGSASGLLAPANTGTSSVGFTAGNTIALDYNADGRDDLIWRQTTTSPSAAIYLKLRNSGSAGFAATATTIVASANILGTTFSPQDARSRRRGLDVNGDGARDFVYTFQTITGNFPNITLVAQNWLHLGNGKGSMLVATVGASLGFPGVDRFGDFNRDGYSDATYLAGTGLSYRLSTGETLGPAVNVGTINAVDYEKSVIRDWDGDGLDDLLVPNSTTGVWMVYKSNGTGLTAGVSTGVATGGPSFVLPIDVNGDGLDDIGYVRSNGAFAVLPRVGPYPDHLSSFTDGYGNVTSIAYVSLSQEGYGGNTGTPVFPNREIRGQLIVARQLAQHNGIGGTRTQTFDYFSGRLDVQGEAFTGVGGSGQTPLPNPASATGLRSATSDLGNANQTVFKGFGSVKVTDSLTGLVTIRDYSVGDPPLLGLMTGERVYQSNGTTAIRLTTMTLSSVDGGTGITSRGHPFAQQTVTQEYEFGGAYNGHLKRTLTTEINAIDAYGTATAVTRIAVEPLSGANGVRPGATYTTQSVLSSLQDSETNWCLGKPGLVTDTSQHNQHSGAAIARTVARSWNTSSLCRLNSETFDTQNPNPLYAMSRAVTYDAYGNATTETWTGRKDATTSESRQTAIDYITGATEPGRFPVSVTNPANETIKLTWNYSRGLLTAAEDPNTIDVQWQYDALSRLTQETREVDGTSTTWAYNDCVSVGCINSNNKTVVIQTEKDSAGSTVNDIWTYRDRWDRVLSTSTRTLSGSYDRNDREYNAQGLLSRSAAPCLWSSCTYFWTEYFYDSINRPTQVRRPVSDTDSTLQTTTLEYLGLTTRVTDPNGKTKLRTLDARGDLARSADHLGYYQQFDSDPFGSLTRVQDSQSNTLFSATYAYGTEALRTSTTDLNAGTWLESPNAFGDVYSRTDAKGQSFSAQFDKLSRITQRTEPEGVSSWTWGTSAVNRNIGQLTQVAGPGYSESYAYDSTGRLATTITNSDATYQFDLAYHPTLGTVNTITYPTSTNGCRQQVTYGYQYGQLKTATDSSPAGACGSTGTVYLDITGVNSRNQPTTQALGNGVVTTRSFDAVTGWIRTIQSGVGGGGGVQNVGYLYNRVGALTQRQDNRQGLTENFFLDDLYRIDTSTVNSVQNLDVDYDLLGNITKKTDIGSSSAWTYDSTKKHQVLNAGGVVSYSYDANGNAITRNGNAITWSSYNYPTQIANGAESNQFFYGPNRERWRQIYTSGAGTETTVTVGGGLLEKVTLPNSTVEWRHLIVAADQSVGLRTRSSSGANTMRYLLSDHQGSITGLLTAAGALEVNESYAAFGQRRNGTTWQLPIPGAEESTINAASRRGYTEHTHLGGMPLLHMNGRVQDSVTGRFLSVDPFIGDVGNTQAWNPYSYVYNRPNDYVDPSGLLVVCSILQTPTVGISIGGGGDFGGPTITTGFIITVVCIDIPDGYFLPDTEAGEETFKGVFQGTLRQYCDFSPSCGRAEPMIDDFLADWMMRGPRAVMTMMSAAKTWVRAAGGAKPLLGRNPQVGGGRTNTDLPGDRATAKSIFRNQTRGQDVTQTSMPNGGVRRTAADGTQIRINPDGTTRLDLPGRGPSPNGETVHIPPRN